MNVRQAMTSNPVTVGSGESLAGARAKMDAGGFRGLPVVDGGVLRGIVTDRDLRPLAGALAERTASSAMTRDPATTTPETPVELAAERLLARKVGGLPVVDNGNVVGIVTTTDLLRAFVRMMKCEKEESLYVEIVPEKGVHDIDAVAKAIAAEGGVVVRGGVTNERTPHGRIMRLQVTGSTPFELTEALRRRGHAVVGVYQLVTS